MTETFFVLLFYKVPNRSNFFAVSAHGRDKVFIFRVSEKLFIYPILIHQFEAGMKLPFIFQYIQ